MVRDILILYLSGMNNEYHYCYSLGDNYSRNYFGGYWLSSFIRTPNTFSGKATGWYLYKKRKFFLLFSTCHMHYC